MKKENDYRIRRIENELWHYLEQTGTEKLSGYVFSVYPRAVNLLLGEKGCERLITICPIETECGPDILFADERESLQTWNIRQGEHVQIITDSQKQVILIGEKCINFSGAERVALPKILPERKIKLQRFHKMEKWIQKYGEASPLFEAYFQYGNESVMKKLFIEKLRSLRKKEKPEDYLRCLCNFSGLGIGLTPSGDDFVAGALLPLYGAWRQLEMLYPDFLSEIVKQTNLIGYHMIQNALEGRARESEIDFVNYCMEEDWCEVKKLMDKMVRFGSTSGTDTILGIFEGMRYAGRKRK